MSIPADADSSLASAPPDMTERRRVPRITPLAAEARALGAAPEVSLQELKERVRKPGEASFFFFDHHFQHNAVKVLPGEFFAARERLAISTLLGSCIAACLWDSRMAVGGVNHFMLPEGDGADVSGRYGSCAMELLINEMMKLGARRETLQAKIFGGAQVMHHLSTLNVGERNTRFVQEYLAAEGIPVVSEDVLDICPRKVVFFPVTGKAMVKRLAHTHPESLAQEAQGRASAQAWARRGGLVTLFDRTPECSQYNEGLRP